MFAITYAGLDLIEYSTVTNPFNGFSRISLRIKVLWIRRGLILDMLKVEFLQLFFFFKLLPSELHVAASHEVRGST